MPANNKTRKYKKGGSGLHLSTNFVKSLINKLQAKHQSSNTKRKIMSKNSIIKRQQLMKTNYNLKIRNLTKKNSSDTNYSNAEVINTSGPEWEMEIGNIKRREKIPKALQPIRKTKGATFIRIEPIYSNISK